MTTANQLIDQALSLLGVKSPGDATEGGEAAQALLRLNTMLDGWRTESLYAWATQRVTFSLPAGQQTATIGPGSDFDIDPRPVRIEQGSFFTTGGLDYPLESVTEPEFNQIVLKAIRSLGPTVVFYDSSLPEGTVYFYPQPTTAVVVTLICQTHLTTFADLTTTYVLAPGYSRALAFSLAEELCADYERQVTPATARIAAQARRNIKRANHIVPQLMVTAPPTSRLGRFYAGGDY